MSKTTASTLATALLLLTATVSLRTQRLLSGHDDPQERGQPEDHRDRRAVSPPPDGAQRRGAADPRVAEVFRRLGTPRSDDDYGFEGLKQVLASKLKRVKSLRYEIEYRNIRVKGKRVRGRGVFLDGSFELAADSGDRYRRVNDYHRFLLEQENEQWKFTGGM
jgi:hypothetical protein